MNVNCIVSRTVRLAEPTKKITLHEPLAYNNQFAHAMQVVVVDDDKQPVELTGVSVVGTFLNNDGVTVDPIVGAVDGNVASVLLPPGCYVCPGWYRFTMNLVSGDASRTVLWVEGMVERNVSGNISDPGTPVGNIEQAVGNANAAAAAANTAAANATKHVAPTEAASTASADHAVGEYFVYGGKLYVTTSAISAGDTITPDTNCEEVPDGLGSEVSELKGHFPATGKFVTGTNTSATEENAVAEGEDTIASGLSSHAEGYASEASGDYSHSEGGSVASGGYSHAEGSASEASGDNAHAEGYETTASSDNSHSEGWGTTASGMNAHAEGVDTVASGNQSHAEGEGTIANHAAQSVSGTYNVADPSQAAATAKGTYAEIVGNGIDDDTRSNARTLDWSGNEELAGDLTINKNGANEMTVGEELSDLKSAVSELGNGYIKLNVTEYIENKVLSSDGKSETANNNRWLSDFIPVTPGSTLYFYVTATTERCAFYTSDDYADVTGGTFTVAAGNPTAKVVPAGAAYIKIGWHKNNGIPNVVTIAPFIDDAAGNGAINKVWSANKLANDAANVSAAITAEDTKIAEIIGKSQFEAVSATVEQRYYKKDGTKRDGYRSATTAVSPGDILEVSGYTLKGTAFVLIVYFDSNYDFLSYAYENANVSAETYTDLVVVVPQGAAKIGVNCMNSNATLAIKRLANYASTSNISDTNDTITKNDKKVDGISRYVNFEDESGTFANGFYNAVTGQWQANNSYGTITFPASYGDLFLVTGKTLAVSGFALALIFNEDDEIIERVYDGRSLSAKTSVRDMPLYISQQNAAWVAVLGAYYYEASPTNYYPHAKRAITKYAHVRKTAVCFGDSTFGNAGPTTDIPSKLTARTGNTVLNGAFGGCRMSYYNGNYGAFSMYKLADAICTGTWTDQDAAMADPTFEPPAYAAQHLANLKSTDFSKVDFITIAYGTNDWRAGNALDDEQNQKNTYTIAGALRYSLEEIMTTYPQIDIYVLSPLWRVVKLEGETDENPTGYCDITPNNNPPESQYYLMDVCDTLKKVCDEYHVTFVNDFDLGINRYNWKNWLVDGTHPNQNGQNLMIGNMIKNIKNILV